MSTKRGKQNSERIFRRAGREEIEKGMNLRVRIGERVKVKDRPAIDRLDIFAFFFFFQLRLK